MISRFRLPSVASLLVLIGAFASTPAAIAQSDADLRREIQALETRNQELEQELQAAQDRIRVLEARIAALERAQQGGDASTLPAEEEKVSIDETEPLASPRAIVAALRGRYEQAMSGFDAGQPVSRERLRYMQELERWSLQAEREFRSIIEWYVTIEDVEPHENGRDVVITAQAVDPEYGTHLGPKFSMILPKNRSRSIDAGTEGEWLVRGRLIADVEIDADAADAGTFDNPLFVGPYAALEYVVEVISLVPAPPPEEDDDGG